MNHINNQSYIKPSPELATNPPLPAPDWQGLTLPREGQWYRITTGEVYLAGGIDDHGGRWPDKTVTAGSEFRLHRRGIPAQAAAVWQIKLVADRVAEYLSRHHSTCPWRIAQDLGVSRETVIAAASDRRFRWIAREPVAGPGENSIALVTPPPRPNWSGRPLLPIA